MPGPSALQKPSLKVVATDWPEAWYMVEDGEVANQKEQNRRTPNQKVTARQLLELGLIFWKMDAENYAYPVKAIPWDPRDATDPRLRAVRDDRGYSYADILTIHPDFLPGFDAHVKNFFEEHLHDAEEIRYILGGSGFFDVRDLLDRWIRIHVKKGDLMVLPEGIYHRFTCDEDDSIHAMRMFRGAPCWTAINRSAEGTEDHPSRQKYARQYCVPFLEKMEANAPASRNIKAGGGGEGKGTPADSLSLVSKVSFLGEMEVNEPASKKIKVGRDGEGKG